MKLYFPLIFVLYIFTSCHSKGQEKETSIIRPVYSPFRLGMPAIEAANYLMKFTLANRIAYNRNFPNEDNQTSTGKKYFSRPLIYVPEGDTLLLGVKICYSADVDDLSIANERDPMFVIYDNPPVFDKEMRDDIISKVSRSYGTYDKKDTLYDPETDLHIRYIWENRNDVDVILDYKATNRYFDNQPYHYYSLFLTYKYTDQMLQKINYRKSRY